jgi:hypothetical protein
MYHMRSLTQKQPSVNLWHDVQTHRNANVVAGSPRSWRQMKSQSRMDSVQTQVQLDTSTMKNCLAAPIRTEFYWSYSYQLGSLGTILPAEDITGTIRIPPYAAREYLAYHEFGNSPKRAVQNGFYQELPHSEGQVSQTCFLPQEKSLVRLHGAIVQVLQSALQSACIEYSRPGHFPTSDLMPLTVYGREGERCVRCQRLIRRMVQGGRSTYYCPGCQK